MYLKSLLDRFLDFIFRRKSFTSILYILVITLIGELAAIGASEDIVRLCDKFIQQNPDSFLVYFALLAKWTFGPGSWIVLGILFILILFFSFLKYKELQFENGLIKKPLGVFIQPHQNLVETKDPIGRKKIIYKLENELNNHDKIAIQGEGGIGKTSFLQYFLKYKKGNFKNLIYLNVGSIYHDKVENRNHNENAFINAFIYKRELLNEIKIEFKDENKKLDSFEKFKMIIARLSNIQGKKKKNLLVIDDVSEVFENQKYYEILSTLNNWKVLVTTRSELNTFSIFKLPNIGNQNAIKLFREIFEIKGDEKLLKEIVKKYDYHPLTIELLAAHAKASRWSVEKMYDILSQKKLLSLDNLNIHDKQTNETQKSLREYLLESFAMDLSDKAKEIMRYFSVMPNKNSDLKPDFTTSEYLYKMFGSKFNFPEFVNILNRLKQLSWIVHQQNGFFCHPTIQEVAFKLYDPNINNCSSFVFSFLQIFNERRKNLSVKDSNINSLELFPILQSLTNGLNINSNNLTNVELLCELNFKSGVFFDDGKKDLEIAINYFEKAISLGEKLSKKRSALGRYYFSHGVTLERIGKPYKAIDSFKTALKYFFLDINENINSISSTYMELSRIIIYNQANHIEAKKYLDSALKIENKYLGSTSFELKKGYATYYLLINDFEQIKKILTNMELYLNLNSDVLYEKKKCFFFFDLVYNYFFKMFLINGDKILIEKAIENLLNRIQFTKELYSPDSIYIASDFSNLSRCYRLNNQLEKSKSFCNKAIKIFEENNFQGDLLIAKQNLASIYLGGKEYSKAINLNTEILGIIRKNHGDDSVITAKHLDILNSSYYYSFEENDGGIEELKNAVTNSERAKKIFELKGTNLDKSINYNLLAVSYELIGKKLLKIGDTIDARDTFSKAAIYYKKEIQIRKQFKIIKAVIPDRENSLKIIEKHLQK